MSDISETYNGAYDIGWEPDILLNDFFIPGDDKIISGQMFFKAIIILSYACNIQHLFSN